MGGEDAVGGEDALATFMQEFKVNNWWLGWGTWGTYQGLLILYSGTGGEIS